MEENEIILDFILSKNYGELITFDELQKYTNYNLKDELEMYKFKTQLISKVKNRLIELGIILKSIRKKGYYILKPNQISSYTYRTYIKKPLRNFEKAKLILNNTEKNKLNNEELRLHNLTGELNNELLNISLKIIESDKYKECNKKNRIM